MLLYLLLQCCILNLFSFQAGQPKSVLLGHAGTALINILAARLWPAPGSLTQHPCAQLCGRRVDRYHMHHTVF